MTEPYVKRDPGDVIRSSDWNDIQIKAREELRDEVHSHRHTGDDGLKIPRAGIETNAINGDLVDPAADVTLNTLTVRSDLKVDGKAILADVGDLNTRFTQLESNKVNRAGDAIDGELEIQQGLTLHGGMLLESASSSSWASSIKLTAPNSPAHVDETDFRIIHYNYPHGNQIEFRSEVSDGNARVSGILALNHDGKVGIGTHTPQARLDVAGDLQVAKGISSQGGQVRRDFLTWNTTADGAIPIHIKTNIKKHSDVMYRILVEGYNYGAHRAINSDIVGYTYSKSETIIYDHANNYAPGATISHYYSTDGFVVIKLTVTTTYYIGFSVSAWFINPNGRAFDISAEVFHQTGNL